MAQPKRVPLNLPRKNPLAQEPAPVRETVQASVQAKPEPDWKVGQKALTVWIPNNLAKAIKTACLEEDKTSREVVIEALNQRLREFLI